MSRNFNEQAMRPRAAMDTGGSSFETSGNTVRVPVSRLRALGMHLLTSVYGHSSEHAETMMNVMMYSQVRDGSQGLVKLTGAGMPRSEHERPMKVEHKRGTAVASIDGGQNPGMVVMQKATELAMEFARKYGVGVVVTRNTGESTGTGSTGAVGYYVKQVAEKGMYGQAFSGALPLVAPEGGSERLLAPNALAMAMEQEGAQPVVYDATTAAMPFYSVVQAKANGNLLPTGAAYDKEGNPTNNPNDVVAGGALRTWGGHKGSGLSMMLEMATGALAGASTAGDLGNADWGNVVIVVNPEKYNVSRRSVAKAVRAFVERVHNVRKAPGYQDVLVPGERGNRRAAEVEEGGEVVVSQQLLHDLEAKASVN